MSTLVGNAYFEQQQHHVLTEAWIHNATIASQINIQLPALLDLATRLDITLSRDVELVVRLCDDPPHRGALMHYGVDHRTRRVFWLRPVSHTEIDAQPDDSDAQTGKCL